MDIRGLLIGFAIFSGVISLGIYIASMTLPRTVILLLLVTGFVGCTNLLRKNPLPTIDGSKTLNPFGYLFLILAGGGIFFVRLLFGLLIEIVGRYETIPSFAVMKKKIQSAIKILFGDMKPYVIFYLVVYIFKTILALKHLNAPNYFFHSIIGNSFLSSMFNFNILILSLVIVPFTLWASKMFAPKLYDFISSPDFEPEIDLETVHSINTSNSKLKQNDSNNDNQFDPSKGKFW